ncbi:pilus assembly protein TadC [Rhodobacteraceae bacterium WD3A24]|nr:pilus assembly protein TadC [Rhodobacteraceae bacterium WD3A24]
MQMLDALNAALREMLGPLGPLLLVGGLGLALIVVTLVAMGSQRRDPLDKLRESRRRESGAQDREPAETLRDRGGSDKLDKYAAFLEPQSAEEMSSARLQMMQAGYRSKSSVRTFHAIQFALGLGFLGLGLAYALVARATGELATSTMMLAILLPGVVGYYIPRYWVNKRREKRQQEITNGFPDALDMMLVCVEAGQSLDQSMMRVAQEMRAGFPALSEEFEIVNYEVKAGKDRVSVLKDMASRCGVADVASFVTVLVQSASFGTSLGDALRVYAAEMRDKRVMRAEEKANVLPTKLTLGTMVFTVPPLLIILIGPSIYGIAQTLSGGITP